MKLIQNSFYTEYLHLFLILEGRIMGKILKI